MWYMITFGPNADPCPLQAVCAVRLARAQTVTCRILETEIHVESVVFAIGMRRFRYVLAI